MKTGLHAHDTTQNQLTPEAPRLLSDVLRGGLDLKLHLLQHYAELARLLAREILDEEVGCLCGKRYNRDKPLDGRCRRWGSNPGSIRIQQERVPIDVPRVRGRPKPGLSGRSIVTSI